MKCFILLATMLVVHYLLWTLKKHRFGKAKPVVAPTAMHAVHHGMSGASARTTANAPVGAPIDAKVVQTSCSTASAEDLQYQLEAQQLAREVIAADFRDIQEMKRLGIDTTEETEALMEKLRFAAHKI